MMNPQHNHPTNPFEPIAASSFIAALTSSVVSPCLQWVDGEFDELVTDVLLPRMDLRKLDGTKCTITDETYDGLFGDDDSDCYINAQAGSTRASQQPRCFPAGAQLLTEGGMRVGDHL